MAEITQTSLVQRQKSLPPLLEGRVVGGHLECSLHHADGTVGDAVPDRLGIDRGETGLSAELQANVNELWSGIDQRAVEIDDDEPEIPKDEPDEVREEAQEVEQAVEEQQQRNSPTAELDKDFCSVTLVSKITKTTSDKIKSLQVWNNKQGMIGKGVYSKNNIYFEQTMLLLFDSYLFIQL